MTITINADDLRSIKAIQIAATAGQWLKCRTADGRNAFGIRSSRDANHVYLATQASCTCPDARRAGLACKHQLAVRLHCELVRALQQAGPPVHRPQLRLLQGGGGQAS